MNAMTKARSFRRSERGYNIVEVLIAMGLLSSVLLSIAALFLFGRNAVYSGKQMTQAVAIANDVMEDLSSMNSEAAYAAFGISNDTVLEDVDVDDTQTLPADLYANSVLRTTKNCDDDTYDCPDAEDPNKYLESWKRQMDETNKFQKGSSVNLVFTPMEDTSADPPEIATASLVRIRVIVRWSEQTRPRQVILDTVKFNRF